MWDHIDLAKAFNLIPRFPAAILLNRLGLSWDILQFWLKSLSVMSRSPIVAGVMGEQISSTTGVPEGDVWSVLAMIGVSTLFYFKNLTPNVNPFSYVDNWSWMSTSTRENFLAWIRTLNLVSALRMVISIAESWMCATVSKNWPELESVSSLFPSGLERVPVYQHAKNFGEVTQYNRGNFVKPLVERVDEAVSRMERLKNLPLSLTAKAKRIQCGIWSCGLYAADTHTHTLHWDAPFQETTSCRS